MTCEHRWPSLCQKLGFHVVGRTLAIWNGTALPPEQTNQVRSDWATLSGDSLATLLAEYPPDTTTSADRAAELPCIFRASVLREVVCRPCQNAGQASIPVYICELHGECVVRGVAYAETTEKARLRTCLTCSSRKSSVSPQAATTTESQPAVARSLTDSSAALPLPPAGPFRHSLPKIQRRWAVGITSAPRPIPTVSRCTASIIAAGWSPTIYAEPATPGLPPGVPAVLRDEQLGCWRNYVQTLRDLLLHNPDADTIAVFQDDVIVANHTREWLDYDLWPSDLTGVVSLYAPDLPGYERGGPVGLRRVTGAYLVGACAMVFPRAFVERAMTLPLATAWAGNVNYVETDPVKKKAVDTWVGHVAKALQQHVYYYNPSLCQHVATTSSLGHGGNNQRHKRTRTFHRRSSRFLDERQSPFDIFAARLPKIRFNDDGGIRLAAPVRVVVPGHNCVDLTSRCLRALAANGGVAPLIVHYVDNGSDGGIVAEVQSLADTLGLSFEVTAFPKNHGFTPAANAGLLAALQAGQHAILLNNDCYVARNCLPAMLRHMLADARVGTVGPLTADNGSQSVRKNKQLARLRGRRDSLARPMVSGFCQLLRWEALRDVGLLDEHIGSHGLGTDDDWCTRARRAGYRVRLALDAFADHDHSSTFRRLGQPRAAWQQESRKYLQEKGTLR